MKPAKRSLIYLVIATSLALFSVGESPAAPKSTSGKLNTLKNNEQRIKQLQQKTQALKQKEQKTKESIADIQQDLEKASRDLDASNRRYEAAHKEVELVTNDLIDSEADFETRMEQAQKRLRKMYMYRHYAKANQLMESQNLAELTRKIGYFRYLAEQDETLLQDLKIKKDKLSRLQYQQMLKRQVLGKQANEQAEAKDKHKLAKDKEVQYLQKLTSERQVYEREQRALERQSRSITDELQRMYARQGASSNNISYGTGRFMHPISGYPLTSRFGWRVHPIFRTRKLHTGQDYGAPAGAQIRAADHGIVISAGWRGGYGKAILIDHGKGIVTLYAHSSAYYVKAGQRVKKGQVIAAVGSTGYSTGPHLHFEVRRNGAPVDPSPWF